MNISRQVRRQQERLNAKGRRILHTSHVEREALNKAKQQSAERLVAVALIRNGETHHGFKSHSELRASLGDEDPYTANTSDQCGFWTSDDRFVSRQVAVIIGVGAGQLPPDWLNVRRELLSSDVW